MLRMGIYGGTDADDERVKLLALGRLLSRKCLDPVLLPGLRLDYEPRTSTACAACGAIWIGSKAGEVVRVDLREPRGRSPGFARGMVNSGVRAILHVHDETSPDSVG